MEGARRAGTVIIVEGQSDKVALETLARRRGLALADAGVEVMAIGGAHAISRFVLELRRERPEVVLRGLCDEREEPDFRRALEGAGSAPTWTAPAWSASASTSAWPTSRTS